MLFIFGKRRFTTMRIAFFLLVLFAHTALKAQKTSTNLRIDSLPESQIDIPIQINLRPFYKLAEHNVDTVFTSPDYPNGWVQSDCATRYKYHFRRSPFKIGVNGTTMNLAFTGFYQIIGATRACVNGTVLSPWTPACRCGFDEPERKVTIGFTSTFQLQPNLFLNTKIIRNEPKALDKCSVCFWGQDVTTSVIDGLKAELDASRKAMEDSFGRVNLRPYLQQAWNMMNTVYAIPNVGFFSLHPKKLRMENINARNDLLNINIGISATPVVSFAKPEQVNSVVPDLTPANNPGGFNIYLEAALQYDSLSRVLNGYLTGKRFEVSEGFFKKHIVIGQTQVSGDENGDMRIRLDFSGSFDGTVFFTGKPVYNAEKKAIEVQDLDYDLQTKNVLLKTAKWLFNKKIISELKKYTSFELSQYYDTASTTLNTWLNREWTKGISGTGS
ncbi:MAG TPA: DUF4403 family protein, partial [Flavisolibacter sp.]|nr:DUF4403 family protein [Flavisolibacter sp.]